MEARQPAAPHLNKPTAVPSGAVGVGFTYGPVAPIAARTPLSQDVAALRRLDVSIGVLPQQQAFSNQRIGCTIDSVDKPIMVAVALR